MGIVEIENAFVTAVAEIDGIEAALSYEPESLPKRPCVTMLLTKTAQEDFATGNVTEGQWEWRVNLYLDLREYKVSQDRMKELIPLLLKVTRLNPKLDYTADWSSLSDVGAPPIFDHGAGILVKQLVLRAETTNS